MSDGKCIPDPVNTPKKDSDTCKLGEIYETNRL